MPDMEAVAERMGASVAVPEWGLAEPRNPLVLDGVAGNRSVDSRARLAMASMRRAIAPLYSNFCVP